MLTPRNAKASYVKRAVLTPSDMATISASGVEYAVMVCLLEDHCNTEQLPVSGWTKQIRHPDLLLPWLVAKLASA